MRVADMMNRAVVTCSDRATLAEAARLMWDCDIGFLPVVSAQGALVGVITDRDALMAAWFRDERPSQIEVGSVMSTGIITCKPEEDLFAAEQLMRKFQVHRLPVVKADGALTGVLSLNDLARRGARDSDAWLEENVGSTLGAIAEPRKPQ